MIPQRLSIQAAILAICAAAVFFSAWSWRGSIADADLAQLKATWEAERAQISASFAAEIQRRAEDHQALQATLAEQDQRHYKELTDARQKADQLAADLAGAKRRMYVATARPACPASAVPAAATGASVDDAAGYAELHPRAAGDLARLAARADACAIALTAFQAREKEREKGAK